MERVRATLEKVGQEKPIFLTDELHASLLLFVAWGECLYLGIWGKGQIYAFRQGEIASLLSGEGDQAKVISGKAFPDDLFLIATDDFYSQLPFGTITACLETGNPDSIAEIITPIVNAQSKQGAIAAAVVRVSMTPDEKMPPNKLPRTLGRSIGVRSKDDDLLPHEGSNEAEDAEPVNLGEESQEINNPGSQGENLLSGKSLPNKGKRFNLGHFFSGRFANNLRLKPRSGVEKKRQKVMIILSVVFLAILIVSIIWGWQKKKEMEKMARRDALYSEAEKKLSAAESIKTLGLSESTLLAKQAVEIVNQGLTVVGSDPKGEELKKRAEDLLASLGGGEKVKPDLFFNLKLLAEGAEGTNLYVGEKKIFVLDAKGGKIFSIEWPQKKTKTLVSDQPLTNKSSILIGNGEDIYLLDDKSVSLVTKDAKLQESIALEGIQSSYFGYWGSNLYLLDSRGKQIWKYPGLITGFGSKVAWIRPTDNQPNWEKISGFAIDGKIWIMDQEGKITEYLGGVTEEFGQKTELVGEAAFLSVSENADRVAFFDNEKKEFWLFNKNGDFLAKIPVSVGSITAAQITPDGKGIFILEGSELSWLSLERYTTSSSLLEKLNQIEQNQP